MPVFQAFPVVKYGRKKEKESLFVVLSHYGGEKASVMEILCISKVNAYAFMHGYVLAKTVLQAQPSVHAR